MLQLSIFDFVATAKFGPIALGTSVETLREEFGQPRYMLPDLDSIPNEDKSLWVYGGVEFGLEDRKVDWIQVEQFGNSYDFGKLAICSTPAMSPNMSMQNFIDQVTEYGCSINYYDTYLDDGKMLEDEKHLFPSKQVLAVFIQDDDEARELENYTLQTLVAYRGERRPVAGSLVKTTRWF